MSLDLSLLCSFAPFVLAARNPCLGSDVDGTCDTAHGGCTVNASNVAYCFCDSGYQLQLNSSGFSLCPSKFSVSIAESFNSLARFLFP